MNPPPRRILVIGLRRLGDLLLSTAAIHSLRQAWPTAQIDVLVVAGTEGMLAGNPDVANIWLFDRSKPIWPLLRKLWRRYDLSVSLQPEDRAQFLALVAAPKRASIVPADGTGRWKRWINYAWHPVDLHDTHAVEQYLRLLDAMQCPRAAKLMPPQPAADQTLTSVLGDDWRQRKYAIVHPHALQRFKGWPAAAWLHLIRALQTHGLEVMLSGGAGEAELRDLGSLSAASGAVLLAGRLALAELAAVLRGAQIYVGPDTSITHLAAACGAPTVALFGPSNPVAWGPWPLSGCEGAASPWRRTAALQQRDNVWLIQGTAERRPGCIPCMKEGCGQNSASTSQCLDELDPQVVMTVVESVLHRNLTA